MRHFRNPRYAPESLERKLSPSAAIPVAAEISIPTTQLAVVNPVVTYQDSAAPSATTMTRDVTPAPAPAPAPAPGGSDPAPPPGDGSVPDAPPSAPSGPLQPV